MKHVSEILIVDDDEEFVADLLKYWRAPLAVRIARSGKEAIEYLRARVPRLVLLDLKLPRFLAETDALEGMEILSYLREQVSPVLPVIVLSDEKAPEIKTHVRLLGADEYIEKPLNLNQLDEEVAKVIGRSDTRR